MGVFRHTVIVNMQDTDAAGILFFANQFVFAHVTYERFLESIGFSFAEALDRETFLLPIVHAESDYRKPLKVGDRLQAELSVGHIGNSSVTLEYTFRDESGNIAGTSKSVHIAVDRKSMNTIPLPGKVRKALENFRVD